MKLLIAYTSKNGVAKKCAEMLGEELPNTIKYDLVDLLEKPPVLDDYDAVVLGGSIHMETLHKKLKKFMRINKARLSSLPCALFICCGLPHRYEEYAEICSPRKLIFSLGVHHFGGELKSEKVKGLDKIIVRSLRSSITNADFEDEDAIELSLPEIIPENIKLLAEAIKNIQ